MFVSAIDNKNAQIRTEAMVNSDITCFTINGSFLEIEGYASIDGLNTYSEERIRKLLVIVPKIDVELLREKNEDYANISDDKIMELHVIKYPLDNCKISEVNNVGDLEVEDMDILSGFKGRIDLSTINLKKPLTSGSYDVFINLEQLSTTNDNIRYEKVIPISNIKKLMGNKVFSTKIQYFSSARVLKYNFTALFDQFSKTLRFETSLLQSYDPRNVDNGNGNEENKYIKAIKRRFFRLCYVLFYIIPVNKRKVVFASDSRRELNGNFYFVYEELYKRNLNLKIEFAFSERIDNRKTFYDLFKTAYQFSTAKIILLDDFYPMIYPLRIRKNADLIQIWHAAGAFKTFGYSRIGRPGGPTPNSKNHKNYTKATVSSEGVRENYAEGFGITVDKVYPTGVPRSDIFFDKDYKAHVSNTLKNKYSFLKNKKVILFAPTFRGNGQSSAYYPFENLNLQSLYQELNEDYVFLFKIHPFVKNKLSIPYEYADFFYDFSDYREINDLLLITDILITDYSSVCFEYALLNKPILFFAFDVEEYIQERDFYYNYFEFIPGPLLKTTSEIIKTIKEERFEFKKITSFVSYFFGDTLGKASQKVVDELIIPSLNYTHVEDSKNENMLPPAASRIELFERSISDDNE